MPQNKLKSQVDQQIQINDLAKDIEVIKDNHLAHMAQDIDELKLEIKDNKDHFDSRMDRLDNRVWWVLGLTVTTLVSILVGEMI